MGNIFYLVVYACGFLMCGVQLWWFFNNKKGRLSHGDVLYASIICLIAAWIFIDATNFLLPRFLNHDFYLLLSVIILTFLAIMAYWFSVSLKRELWFVDVLLMFPLILVSMFYVLQKNWRVIIVNGVYYYHFLTNDTFYWLASLLIIAFLNINVLYRLSFIIRSTLAYKRVFGIIIAESVGLSLAIISNVFLYPWLVSARTGSFFMAFSFFIAFWADQSVFRKKLRRKDFGRDARGVALKRINDFL